MHSNFSSMYAPPAAHQYSTNVQQNAPQHKNSGGFNFRKAHLLIHILQGGELVFEERMAIVECMYGLDINGKAALIDFLASKNGAIASTLENNACKSFLCTPDELKELHKRDFSLKTLLDFWEFVQVQIIPNFLSVTYPLEDSDFRPRQTIFVALRNKVLLPILKDYRFKNIYEKALIRPVLASMCFVAADRSEKHAEFVKFSDRILFEDNIELESVCSDVPILNQHTQSNQSIHLNYLSVDDSILGKKPRSKTLPKSKSVRWENLINLDESSSVDV